MEPKVVESLSDLEDLLRFYETAIERQKKLVHEAFSGKTQYSELGQEKFYALTKFDLKTLNKAKQKISKEVEDRKELGKEA